MSDFQGNMDKAVKSMEENNYAKAIELLQIAKEQNTKNVRVCRLLGNCLRVMGRVEEAVDAYQAGLSRKYHSPTHERLLNTLNYTEHPQEYIAREHLKWASHFESECPELPAPVLSDKLSRSTIRIGYVSSDFMSHPVAYFLMPILKNHDKGSFHITCYHTGSDEDAITRKIMSFADHWRSVHKMSAEAMYTQIKEDEIDILVDLSGHTSGNRLDVFALKPAAHQVTYLGYPNTTGLHGIDYRIVDAITDPKEVPDSWHSERLHRMKNCFLCFEPPPGELQLKGAPVRKNGYVTFGTFNKVSKITDKTIQAWVQILKQVSGSKIMLKSIGFDSEIERKHILERFLNAGLNDTSRVLLFGLVPTRSSHMLMYNEIDIALDTSPYNGTTTTMQSLYMGVPVITLQGQSHISRVSSSILHSLELDELVAHTTKQYCTKAVELALNIDKIEYYKKHLRNCMLNSCLVDGARFTRELESFYQSLHAKK